MDFNSEKSSFEENKMYYSLEAEQSVLGAVLIDSTCLEKIAEILTNANYFYISSHKKIYSLMLEMFTSGQAIDYITLLEKLKLENDESINYKSYLLQLAQIVPSVSNVEFYAKIVRDKYSVRTLVNTANEIIENANASELNPSELLNYAEQKIFDIRRGKETSGLQKINEIVIQTFDKLDSLISQPNTEFSGVPTGIKDLDRVIMGLNKTDLILLAARPGMGKTSFALNIAHHVGVVKEKKVAFFSLEMSKEQLVSRMLSSESRVSGHKLRMVHELTDTDWARLIEAGDVLSKAPIYIDDTPGITIPEMKARLRRLGGADLVVIDYLQLMSSPKNINNRVQEISEITRNLKILAKELNAPVITLSQLSRASEQRTDHKPVLSDLRDSGSIEQDADIVLFLYREGYYSNSEVSEDTNRNSGECIVAKNRHGETRSVPLHWQGEFMRFTAREGIRNDF